MKDFGSTFKLMFGKPGLIFTLCFYTNFLALANSQLFSINPSVFEERFDLDDEDVRLFLVYQCLTVLLFTWLVFRAVREGRVQIRYWLIVFSGCIAFGSTLRMIPLYTGNSQTWIFHIAQLIIPFGILSNALAAQLSVVWFPPKLRSWTTSFIVIAGELGAATLKAIGAMVTTDVSEASRMFYAEAIAAVTLFALVLLFCPNHPSNSRIVKNPKGYQELDGEAKYRWNKGVWQTVVHLALLRGVKSPVFANMTDLLMYDHIDNEEAAYISSIQGFTPIFGALFLGYAMRFKGLRAQRRVFLILVLFLYGCLQVWFSLSFTSVFWSTAPISYTYLNSFLTEVFAGVFWGIIRPLSQEYVSELSYPTEPVYFNLWITLGRNCVSLGILLIPSWIADEFIFQALFIAVFICVALISCTPPRLQRDLENFSEGEGYGSSVYKNIMKNTKGESVSYVRNTLVSEM